MTLSRFVREANCAGIAFYKQSLKCGICRLIINEHFFTKNQDPELAETKIFDCKKKGLSGYNHTFHKRCLKKFLETDHDQNRINKKAHALDKDWERLLRCPTCYPHSQDFILNDTQNRLLRRADSKTDPDQSFEDSDSSSKSSKSSESK